MPSFVGSVPGSPCGGYSLFCPSWLIVTLLRIPHHMIQMTFSHGILLLSWSRLRINLLYFGLVMLQGETYLKMSCLFLRHGGWGSTESWTTHTLLAGQLSGSCTPSSFSPGREWQGGLGDVALPPCLWHWSPQSLVKVPVDGPRGENFLLKSYGSWAMLFPRHGCDSKSWKLEHKGSLCVYEPAFHCQWISKLDWHVLGGIPD